MLFILCESSLKLFNKNIPELNAETYKNIMMKMYDLHKRVQHLELIEWKHNNN